MGASDSFPLPRYSCCIRPDTSDGCGDFGHCSRHRSKSSTASGGRKKTPWGRRHCRNLSATFNLTDPTMTSDDRDVINLNTATEEELMTLPGIDRQTARNVVDYRRRIGGFRKVEDMALVTGVGAARLALLRPEVCVAPRSSKRTTQTSGAADDCSSSTTSSSGIVGDDRVTSFGNVSSGTAASTAGVPLADGGQSESSLADVIVSHRRRPRGGDVDDLVGMGDVGSSMLADVGRYLAASGRSPDDVDALCVDDELLMQDFVTKFRMFYGNAFNRPRLVESGTRSDVVRIASWNLDDCSAEKMDNPGVREVVAMTVLENRLSVIALQGIGDKEVLDKICAEMHAPTVLAVKRWKADRGNWKYIVSTDKDCNQLIALLYDADRVTVTQHPCDSHTQLSLSAASITTGSGRTLSLVNVFIPRSTADVVDRVISSSIFKRNDNQNTVFISNIQPSAEWLESAGLRRSPAVDTDTTPTTCFNNIWLSESLYSRSYTGSSGVIRDGLTSPWIPDGWKWGGAASRFCPVWAEFTN